MSDHTTILNGLQVESEGLADWRPLLGRLMARFETGDFVTGLAFVNRIAEAAEAANHHPDLELTYPAVTIGLASHDVGGITSRDVDLARVISDFAAEAGVAADTASVAVLELALDTGDVEAIQPFWAAVLGMKPGKYPDDLVDPFGQTPTVWFQQVDSGSTAVEPEAPQRWHLDLRIPPEQVQPRIDAALAAGGTMVTDEYASAFWVLADPQGNKVCLTTWQGRSHA
jgi:4a-hydroxytetrahydrobiopterin dehydratase